MACEWAELVPPRAFFPLASASLSLASFGKGSKSHGRPSAIATATVSPQPNLQADEWLLEDAEARFSPHLQARRREKNERRRGRPQGPIEFRESSIVSELEQAVSEFLDKGCTRPGLPEEGAGLGGQRQARTPVTWSFGPAGPVHLLVGS
ncbi:hypothetical protein AOLI_G00297800 [Acnodon oligacanthus]